MSNFFQFFILLLNRELQLSSMAQGAKEVKQ